MNEKEHFLLIANNSYLEELFLTACQEEDFICHVAPSFEEALQKIDSQRYQFIFIDVENNDLKPLQLLEWLRMRYIFAKIGLVFNSSHKKEFLQAVALGATEFIFSNELDLKWLKKQLSHMVVCQRAFENLCFKEYHKQREKFTWIGADIKMRNLQQLAEVVSLLPLAILIKGQTGTGKTSFAQYITRNQNVLEFNLSQIPDYLQKKLIQEALTQVLLTENAKADNISLSLVLENIEFLHQELQEMLAEYFKTRLLDIGLEDQNGRRKFFKVMLQLVATTTLELQHRVEEDVFRQDLCLLLQKHQFILPRLNERIEDIPYLANYFVEQESQTGQICYFAKDAMAALMNYEWPGNVSELQLMIKQVVPKIKDNMISSKHFPGNILEQSFYTASSAEEDLSNVGYNEAKKIILNKFNHDYIVELLRKSDNNLTVAAEKAGMDRSNFKKIMKKYGVER